MLKRNNINTMHTHVSLSFTISLWRIDTAEMVLKRNQSRTNGPINAHLTIAQVYLGHNNENQEALLKMSAIAQQ